MILAATDRVRRLVRAGALAVLALAAVPAFAPPPAFAQALVATVNDSPITNYDLEQRMRFLRVIRLPHSRDAALESIIEDRLKLIETHKYGINPSERDLINEAVRDAGERKIAPNALEAGFRSARIDKSHWEEHYRAQIAWRALIGALNKGVNVSEAEVRAEMAKQGKNAASTEYRLRQIVFVVSGSATVGSLQARAQEANQLRQRFDGCEAGAALARGLRDVAVQPLIIRRANQLSAPLVKILNDTPVGKLTPPQRGPNGIEMIAVCGRSATGSDTSAEDAVRETLLTRKLKAESERRYQEVRKRAVIVRR